MHPKQTWWHSIGLTCAIAMMLAMPVALAAPPQPPTVRTQHEQVTHDDWAPRPASDEAAATLQRMMTHPTDVNFQETAFEDALRYLAGYHAVPIEIDKAALAMNRISPATPLSLDLDSVSLVDLLKLLLEPLQLDWYIEGRGLVVTSRSAVNARFDEWIFDIRDIQKAEISGDQLVAVIHAIVEPGSWHEADGGGSVKILDNEMRLFQRRRARSKVGELLGELRKALANRQQGADPATNLTTRIYEVADLRQPTIEENGNKLEPLAEEDFLALLRQYAPETSWKDFGGLGLLGYKENRLLVKQTPRGHETMQRFLGLLRSHFRQQAPRWPLNDSHFKWAGVLWDAMRQNDPVVTRAEVFLPCTLQIDDMPLEKAIKALRKSTGLPIFLDRETLMSEGLPLDVRVTVIANADPASLALDRALQPVGLDWFVHELGHMLVTSPKKVASHSEIHVYRFKDLLTHGQTEQSLLDQITATIDPAGWSTAGGTGVIRALPGLLVVSHNRHVHEQVAAFLESRGSAAK